VQRRAAIPFQRFRANQCDGFSLGHSLLYLAGGLFPKRRRRLQANRPQGFFIPAHVTAWPGLVWPTRNPLSLTRLHRPAVPANVLTCVARTGDLPSERGRLARFCGRDGRAPSQRARTGSSAKAGLPRSSPANLPSPESECSCVCVHPQGNPFLRSGSGASYP